MRVSAKTLILLAMLGALTVAYAQSNAPPRADFRFSPQNPDTNTIITFDASSSRDPDGTIVSDTSGTSTATGRFDETKTTPTHDEAL
jgi:hypothetical protein